jgi:G:T-mismatch repair DNA endonuclease (very short patch repair protein)
MEINIKYEIILNGYKLLKATKIKNRTSFILENGQTLNRRDIHSIVSVCDKCSSKITLKGIPENYILSNSSYLCKVCRNTGENNPMFGKKWSDERKNEISIKYTGENNPMFGVTIYDKWVEKYGEVFANLKKEEYSNKQSLLNSGENNPMFGKTYYDKWVEKYGEEEAKLRQSYKKDKNRLWLENNPEQLNRMIINSHKKKYRKTGIEVKLEKYLLENKINHKYNFILDNKYQFDFLIKDKNIIIETHGDYWHANPNTYSDIDINKKSLNDQQRYKVDLDNKKLIYLKDSGYEVIYLWETEINNNEYKKILKRWNL